MVCDLSPTGAYWIVQVYISLGSNLQMSALVALHSLQTRLQAEFKISATNHIRAVETVSDCDVTRDSRLATRCILN